MGAITALPPCGTRPSSPHGAKSGVETIVEFVGEPSSGFRNDLGNATIFNSIFLELPIDGGFADAQQLGGA
jgi:hypothetical protein